MAAVINDISDPYLQLPEFLVIDASLLLELGPIEPHPKHHSIALDFLRRVREAAQSGKVKPLIPYLVLEECYFKICKYCLKKQGGLTDMPWDRYYKANPEFIGATIYPMLMRYYQMLKTFPMVILDPIDLSIKTDVLPIADTMTDFIRQFNILPKDATILSEAKRIGVFYIATLDRDYLRADGFTILFPQN